MKRELGPEVIEVTCVAEHRPQSFKMHLCLCDVRGFENYLELSRYLHPAERPYFERLKIERRKQSYLLGRFAAKYAASVYGGRGSLEEIFIDYGFFGQPVVLCERLKNVQVSLTHSETMAAAIACSEGVHMGIDLEWIDPRRVDALRGQATAAEKELTKPLPLTEAESLTLLWTAKEALSKALKIGLTVGMDLFEVSRMEGNPDHLSCFFKQFPLFKAVSFRLANYYASIVVPTHVHVHVDESALSRWHGALL